MNIRVVNTGLTGFRPFEKGRSFFVQKGKIVSAVCPVPLLPLSKTVRNQALARKQKYGKIKK